MRTRLTWDILRWILDLVSGFSSLGAAVRSKSWEGNWPLLGIHNCPRHWALEGRQNAERCSRCIVHLNTLFQLVGPDAMSSGLTPYQSRLNQGLEPATVCLQRTAEPANIGTSDLHLPRPWKSHPVCPFFQLGPPERSHFGLAPMLESRHDKAYVSGINPAVKLWSSLCPLLQVVDYLLSKGREIEVNAAPTSARQA